MKKTVLTFGLISGAIAATLMLSTIPFADQIGFDKGMYVGYTAMVISFLMVFFGVRSYRENVGGGTITFGKAFTVGILITLISCACYVIAWEVTYFFFMPDFFEKYSAYLTESLKASGATQQAIAAKAEEMKKFKAVYDNPFFNAAFTFIEPFPVGLVMTLLSALILRKRNASVTNSGERSYSEAQV
jgi:ABC-type microcin C transport system permease subunit YejB